MRETEQVEIELTMPAGAASGKLFVAVNQLKNK
jgi:hypothetical protein